MDYKTEIVRLKAELASLRQLVTDRLEPVIPHSDARINDAESMFDAFAEFTRLPPSPREFLYTKGPGPDLLPCGTAPLTIPPAANPPPTAAVHSDTDSDPRSSSRESAPVVPPLAPAEVAPPAPQDPIDVHDNECNTKRGMKFFCDCRACEGHDRSCARWEGFDLCDCSLGGDPYQERTIGLEDLPDEAEIAKADEVGPCSFCGKSRTEVAKLICGPRVQICNVCTELSASLCSNEPAKGARLAIHLKAGALDEVTAGSFLGVENGKWRVKIERRGVALLEPGECLVCPGTWRVG